MVKVTLGITLRLLHSMAYCKTAGQLSGAAPWEVPPGRVGVPGLCPLLSPPSFSPLHPQAWHQYSFVILLYPWWDL